MQATPESAVNPPARDHAPAGVRDKVRGVAEDAWREPVRVVYLRRVYTKFRVPGRREDGTTAGKHMVRRFFRNLGRLPLLVIALLVEGLLQDSSDLGFVFGSFFRRGAAHGSSATSTAVRVAETANEVRRNLWLAWSDRHFALIHAGATEAPRMLCIQEGADRAKVRADNRPQADGEFTLRWRDHSSLELHVDRRERRRFKEHHGLR